VSNLASSITIEHVHAAYGAVRVLEDVTLSVNSGETVALLGTNGNGKSTLMKCVMGIVRPTSGRIVVEIDGERHDLAGLATEEIVDLGIALVPEGRRLFPKLTVEENLLLGASRKKARAQINTNKEFCFEAFPRLAERRGQLVLDEHGDEHGTCYIVKGRGLVVISSCGHTGIVNTVRTAMKVANVNKLHAVIGGFHLGMAPLDYIKHTVDELEALAPDVVVPMHCTGANFIDAMRRRMPDRIVASNLGSRFTFGI